MSYKYNSLLRLDLQKQQEIPEPPEPTYDDALSDTSENAVQNKVITNKIKEISSDSIDIDVSTLSEFVEAIERSAEVSVRIHLRDNISLVEDLSVNLDNCQIYGHDNRIYLENHTFFIQGEYCYFYQVRFNASSLVTAQTANQSDYFNARIKIISTKASTRFFFEYVIFMNFVCHSFDEQHTIIEVDTTSTGSPSLHTYFLYCEVMTNYLGSYLPRINDCVWSLENVGNSLHCITAHIIDYWGVGFDGTNYDSTKNFNFSGNTLKGFAKLGFTSDASINYAASPSGYTSLTPNAVNIYNPSSTDFKTLSDYVHGNHFATAAQGAKAETALQSIAKGTDGKYITMTIGAKADNSQTVDASLIIQDIDTADAQHQGVAEASDVKKYFTTYIPYNPIYGIMWDRENPDPDCVRIGNLDLHATLPVHSQIVGGTLTDAGAFSPFADQSDWTGETRDGSVGQVMSRLPKFYYKFITEGTKCKVLFSADEVSGFQVFPMQYISSYKATLQRSTSKLSSVVNLDADYRGGNNNADWDGSYRTLLGKPASNISLTNFRTYARNRNDGDTQWNAMVYMQRKMLYWLFAVEYATRNTQKAYNAALDSNGCRQGGLGVGVTDWNWDSWNAFNGYYPLIPCGYTDEYGNATAQKQYDLIAADGVSIAHTFQVPRYRGIESPFGDIWEWSDGILVSVQADDAGGKSPVYVTADPSKFSSTDFTQYDYVCDEIRSENYIKDIHFGDNGDIICTSTPGASTQYYCDWWYGANLPSSGTSLRGVRFGGAAIYGARAGLVYGSSNYAPASVNADIGSRLCYIPELT